MKKSPWRAQSKNHTSTDDFISIHEYDKTSEDLFRLHVPEHFKKNIDFSNTMDPLLLQILPSKHEHNTDPDFTKDPVGDLIAKKAKGVIHKYNGRVLLIATGTCAINCRYCFRRSFPYSQNNASANNWKEAVKYIEMNQDIHEVILSGGDPLMLSTKTLNELTVQIQGLSHIKTLRIHTRMPLVSPTRVNDSFLKWLNNIPLKKVMVLHCNHPNELTKELKKTLKSITKTNTLMLNQSVLLKNINDNIDVLSNLSHRLFDYGVLPYYLNHLDKVQGTQHFQVSGSQAKSIHKQLLQMLPGYLVPKLVKEIQGKKNKSPMF